MLPGQNACEKIKRSTVTRKGDKASERKVRTCTRSRRCSQSSPKFSFSKDCTIGEKHASQSKLKVRQTHQKKDRGTGEKYKTAINNQS